MQSKNITYIEKLDHMRFFAAFVVLMFHTNLWYVTKHNLRDAVHIPVLDQGYTGVSLFMVISGLLFTLIVHGKDIDTKKFYLNRVLRIYPLFIVIVTLGYFSTPDPRETSVGIDYLMALLPISNLYRLKYGAYGGVLFSVAIELQFYLIFPFLLAAFRQHGVKFYLGLIGFLIMLRVMVHMLTGSVHHLAYYTIFGGLDLFLIGCLAGLLFKRYEDVRIAWWWCVLAFIAVNLVIFAVHRYSNLFHFDYDRLTTDGMSRSRVWILWPDVQGVMWAAFVLAYLKGDFRTPLTKTWNFLGLITYSLYVWHTMICMIVSNHPPLFGSPYLTGLLIVLPLAVGLSAASYWLIEAPFLHRRVRYVVERTPDPRPT